ncbi:MAG: Hpt domain-containing protein, partial [Spirochaetales bacterium]|nr:Hpt domain-containing protein [Spirochaetales bacterium]
MDTKDIVQLIKRSNALEAGDLEAMLEIQESVHALLGVCERQGFSYPRADELKSLAASLPELPDTRAFTSCLEDFGSAIEGADISMIDTEGMDDVRTVQAPSEPRGVFPYPDSYFEGVINDAKILSKFIEEATDHLDKAQFVLIDLEYDPGNAENINTIFRAFHTLKSSSAFLGIKNIEEIAHAAEELLSLMRDNQLSVSTELIDVIFYGIVFIKNLVDIIVDQRNNVQKIVEDFREINIYRYIQLLDSIKSGHRIRKIGEILLDMGTIDKEMVDSILTAQKGSHKRFGEIAVEEGKVSQDAVDTATEIQKKQKLRNSYVKVSAQRLNELVDLIGELVVNQSIIREVLGNRDITVDQHLTQLEVISSSIKNNVLSMGMIPIGDTFNHLRVVIRNASKETGKTVDVHVEGGETELDRNIIESIYDPLVHIVRNSVDHGLEDREGRKAAGKKDIGIIQLSARHRGSGIEIQVSDDGRGIDTEALLSTALEKGLIQE